MKMTTTIYKVMFLLIIGDVFAAASNSYDDDHPADVPIVSSEPLCAGSSLTVELFSTVLFALATRHKLSKAAISDVIDFMKLGLPGGIKYYIKFKTVCHYNAIKRMTC
jgi:hypothetical protein